MFLPPSSENAPLTSRPQKLPNKIAEKAVFLVQSQAFPAGWSVLKLGLGLSGIFNILCGSTALAEPGFQGPEPTDSVAVTPSLTALDLLTANTNRESVSQGAAQSVEQKGTGQGNHSGDRTTRAASYPQSPRWETTGSSHILSPTELSFHPAPVLTEMGPVTRTLTSNRATAHNHTQHHSQRLAVQAKYQPRFSSTTATARPNPETSQAAANEAPTQVRLSLASKAPLDIAKLSAPTYSDQRAEPVALLALSRVTASQLAEGSGVVDRSGREVIAQQTNSQPPELFQTELSLEELIAGSLVTEGPIAEEPANSVEGISPELEGFPDGVNQEVGPDVGPGVLPDALPLRESESAVDASNELGTLRVQPTRSRASEELGILRLMQTAQAPPPPPKPPISFLTGRLGFFSSENAFRSNPRIDESIYQSGLAYYLFPKLSDRTSLYAIAETNLARYDQFQSVNYNELEVQLGVRQRLLPRTYAQIGWRNQRLYSPGYREKLFSVNYIDTMVSHRSILNSKTWVDGFYQARLGFANPETASRFRQTFTVSLNYGATRDLRTSLLYQLDFDDYTNVSRFDTYQQLLGIVSYNLTPESRISVFGGTRFGRSSSPGVNLDDTFYGAGLNVSVPLF
ncbi:MAG: hypothetical protein AAFP03_14025 [Cyanobacteria bacterium J06598_3]